MRKDEFKNKLQEIITDLEDSNMVRSGFDVKADNKEYKFGFAVRCLDIADARVITFGGYACHFEIYDTDIDSIEEIVTAFEVYIKQYEGMTFKDCKIVKADVM